jgi:arsenite methyltransferase
MKVEDDVKDYYGKVLQQSGHLKTDACATAGDIPRYINDILVQINDEVMARYYGCGLIAPQALQGYKVLDLGGSSGRDAYVLACLVGESGSVTGVFKYRLCAHRSASDLALSP